MSLGQTRMQKKNTRLPNQPAFTCLIIINSKFDLYLTIWIIADTWSISLEHRRTDTCKCSNQGFKCFTTHLSRDRQRNKFPKFWSSQLIFLILKQPTGSFRFYGKTILMRHVHWSNASTVISVGRRQTWTLNNWG